MLKRILIFSLLPLVSFANSQKEVDELTFVSLELLSQQVNQSFTIGEFLASLDLPSDRKSQLQTFFKQQNVLDKQMPEVNISGKTFSFVANSRTYTFRFEPLPQPRFTLNDQVIYLTDQSVESIHHKINLALYSEVKTSLIYELFRPAVAHAFLPGVLVPYVIGVLGGGAVAVTQQVKACLPKESPGANRCFLRSNLEILKMSVRKGQFTDFKCTDNRLLSYNTYEHYVGMSSIRRSFFVSYENKPMIQTITETMEQGSGALFMKHKIRTVAFQNPKNSTNTRDLKFLKNTYPPKLETYDKGKSIDSVMNQPVSRLANCCSDKACETELHQYIDTDAKSKIPNRGNSRKNPESVI